MLRKVLTAIVWGSRVTAVGWAEVATASYEVQDGSNSAAIEQLARDFFTDNEESDLNGDGIVDFLDLALLRPRSSVSGTSQSIGLPLVNMLFFTDTGQSDPVTQVSVTDQDQLFLDLQMSFDETTIGGGIEILFDAGVLTIVDVVFSGSLGDDPTFRCPTLCDTDVDLGFGGLAGITGDKVAATVSAPLQPGRR